MITYNQARCLYPCIIYLLKLAYGKFIKVIHSCKLNIHIIKNTSSL